MAGARCDVDGVSVTAAVKRAAWIRAAWRATTADTAASDRLLVTTGGACHDRDTQRPAAGRDGVVARRDDHQAGDLPAAQLGASGGDGPARYGRRGWDRRPARRQLSASAGRRDAGSTTPTRKRVETAHGDADDAGSRRSASATTKNIAVRSRTSRRSDAVTNGSALTTEAPAGDSTIAALPATAAKARIASTGTHDGARAEPALHVDEPAHAQPFGVYRARVRSSAGAADRNTKLPPSSTRPKVTVAAIPSACRSVRANMLTRAMSAAVAADMATARARRSGQGPPVGAEGGGGDDEHRGQAGEGEDHRGDGLAGKESTRAGPGGEYAVLGSGASLGPDAACAEPDAEQHEEDAHRGRVVADRGQLRSADGLLDAASGSRSRSARSDQPRQLRLGGAPEATAVATDSRSAFNCAANDCGERLRHLAGDRLIRTAQNDEMHARRTRRGPLP